MIIDTRKDLQVQELQSFLTEWVSKGKISGYIRYIQSIDKWLSQITNGKPLTRFTADEETDKSSITKLTDFIVSSQVDIKVLEQLRDLYTDISIRYVDVSRRNTKFWDKLSLELDQKLNQYKVHSTIGSGDTTYISMATHPELQLTNLSRHNSRGVYLPGLIDSIEQEPNNIIFTTYPAHNPEGGVTVQDPESLSATQNIRKLFRGAGIEQWIWTTEIPQILLDGITYPGIVWEIELEYQGSITFSSIELKFRSKFPTTLCNIYTKNLDTDDWSLVDRIDGGWDHVRGAEIIQINDLVRTSARKIRIRLCQDSYEIRNQDTNNYIIDGQKDEDLSWLDCNQSFQRLESNIYDDSLTELETGKKSTNNLTGQFLYKLGLISVGFDYKSYLSNGNGEFWTHPTVENSGIRLESEPIETVTIVSEQNTPQKTTVEWWVEDITRRFQIPILPMGTSRVREPLTFIDRFTAQLTFPIASNRTPDIYLNGNLMPNTTREINSTQFDMGAVSVGTFDNYVVEYDLAVGEMVMAYVFVNDNFRSVDDTLQPIVVTIASSNTTANSIYVNRQEIDSWIVSQSLNETMHSAAVMIRIDEYNYWFNNGAQACDLGNIVKTIPRVYSPPEL